MSAAERMRNILNATGAFKLSGETSADWETNSCGVGIDSLDEKITSLLCNAFAASAGENGLKSREKIFGWQTAGASIEDRRLSAAAQTAINPQKFTVEDLPQMLTAAGIVGDISEENGTLKILFGRTLGITKEEAKRRLEKILPAHLQWEWDETLNWAVYDALALKFSALDAQKMSWKKRESLTREQLEEYKKGE